LKAAIFDMDGLLLDSEPLWKEAEVAVFKSVGVPLTEELCRETVGVRLDGVVRHWYRRYPWQDEPLDSVEARVLAAVSRLIEERGRLMPGVSETIEALRAENYALAVASSSPMQLMRTALEKLEIIDFFSVLHSAEFEERGKPDPAVYRSAIAQLGVDPEHCIAFEDSVIGVRAAKGAGARVIAVPDPADISNPGFATADVVLASLTDFSLKHLG
jgi:HAD superfamily hydrolase (TIGR01509 family)